MYIIFSIIFKIKSKSVSRVLSRTAIYLVHILLYASSHQIKKMTSSLSLLVSVLLQMGFTLTLYVTIKAVSSYLAFSPLPAGAGGCFLSHYSAVADSFPLGNMVLFVARTFLASPVRLATDPPAQIIFNYM